MHEPEIGRGVATDQARRASALDTRRPPDVEAALPGAGKDKDGSVLTTLAAAGRGLLRNPGYVLGRFRTIRRAHSHVQRLARPSDLPLEIGPLYAKSGDIVPRVPSGRVLSDHSRDDHVARLRKTAWSDGIRLTPETVAALVEFAHDSQLTYRPMPGYHAEVDRLADLTPERRKSLTTAVLTTDHANPIVRDIAGDPILVDVLEDYLGFRPRMVEPYFFWSFKSDLPFEERVARQQTVEYHFDVHTLNFAYIAFYLFDTDRTNGAHVLVEGSHNSKKIGQLFGSARISDAVAEAQYGADKVQVIEKPAGEGFFEDTSCYHKALPPADGDRLILQLRYS